MSNARRVNASLVVSGDVNNYNVGQMREFVGRYLEQKGFNFSHEKSRKDGKRLDRFVVGADNGWLDNPPVVSVFPQQKYSSWVSDLHDSAGLIDFLQGASRIALLKGRDSEKRGVSEVYCAADVWTMAGSLMEWIDYTGSRNKIASGSGWIGFLFDNGKELIVQPKSYSDFNVAMELKE